MAQDRTSKKIMQALGGGLTSVAGFAGSVNFFFILCLIFHLYDISTGFREVSARLGIYIILTIIAWLTIFKKEVGVFDVADLKVPVIVSSIVFIIPYVGNWLPFLGASQAFQTAVIFFPIWPITIAFGIGRTRLLNVSKWIMIVIWILLFLPSFIVNIAADLQFRDIQTGINVQETVANAGRDIGHNWNMFWGNVWAFPGKIGRELNKMIRYATGDYYTGKVDEYEHEPVGVYLEDLEAADSKFFEGEKITVWAVLKAKTLDKEININVSCYAKEGDKKIEGNITPKNEFNIATEEEEYLDCTFDKLNPGKKDVTFNAEFNFETMAYLKTYLMDKERLRAFKREGIDVFSHYKISHRNPIAIYTNGPIGIGMRTAEPLPVGIYSDKENIPFFFGITIENNWEGIIKKVTDLEVQVHDSLELTNCDHEFEFRENEESYNIYSLVPDKRTENIKTGKFHSIKCRLYPLDPRSLLGNEPITTRYFRVTANYIYELEKSTPVEIEEVREYKSPEEAMTSEEETQEFKDKLNEDQVDGKTNKEIACDVISKCSDYDANYYDKLGFNDQAWCDDNPCKLMCYSFLKEDEGGIYYYSCEKCPSATIAGYLIPELCGVYKTEKYCEKDSCNFGYYEIECKWEKNLCVGKIISPEKDTEHGLIEQGCELTREERIKKVKDVVDETNTFIPREIVLGVAQQEYRFEHCDDGSVVEGWDGEIGLMQIMPSTAKEFCSEITENQLRDLDLNIQCGIKVLEGKYTRYVTSGIYKASVNLKCKKSEYPDENELYLSYMGNEWDMTLRAYNGFSCEEGDIHYVEHVRDKIEEFGFD